MIKNVIIHKDTPYYLTALEKMFMIEEDDIFEEDYASEFDPYTLDVEGEKQPEEYELGADELLVEKTPSDSTISKSLEQKDKRNWKIIENERKKQARTEWLTQRIIDRAQGKDKEYAIYHSKIPGLGMRVRPSGSKTFVLVCNRRGGGTGRIRIGDPAVMTLSQAEDKAREKLRIYQEGGDPFAEERETQKDNERTVGMLFKQHMIDTGKSVKPHWRKQKEQLYHDFFEKDFGNTPISQLKRGDWVRRIKLGSSAHIQRHLKCVASSLYAWCVDLEYVEMNLLAGLKLEKVRPRNRPLKDEELAAIWHASFKLTAPFGAFVRLLMLSGQRRSEVSNLPWSEIDFGQKTWTLPASRSKNGDSHIVPLTDTMLDLINEMPRTSKFVFESTISKGQAINSFSKLSNQWKKILWVKNWRLHDLRHAFSTNMAKLRIPLEVTEALLNHRSGAMSGIAGVYNHHKYEDEKREALEKWHQQLALIVEKHKDYTPPPEPDEGVEM